MTNRNFYPFFITLVLSIVFFIIYIFLARKGIILSLEPNESIGDISRWCERVSGGIFREPSNALSNIGFMILGLLMFWILAKDIKSNTSNQFTGLNSISILYAGAALFLGPGSLLMHGTHTEWGEWADNLSMIMYIIIPWLLNIKEMGRWSLKIFFSSYFIIVFIYAFELTCTFWIMLVYIFERINFATYKIFKRTRCSMNSYFL